MDLPGSVSDGLPTLVIDHPLVAASGGSGEALDGQVAGWQDRSPQVFVDDEGSISESQQVRNSYWSRRLGDEIWWVWHGVPEHDSWEKTELGWRRRRIPAKDFRLEAIWSKLGSIVSCYRRYRFALDSVHAGSQAWDLKAESRAILTLAGMLTAGQFNSYMLTGWFVEKSKRSQAWYVFRKLRPTLVLLEKERGSGDLKLHPSCTLCLHPLAYYRDTYAGAMVPTDDVIAHLALMRGDEHGFWRRANQIPIDRPEAGI